MTRQTMGFISVPLSIIQDKRLTAPQKILYGIIFSNMDDEGYCRMKNRDFSKILNVSTTSVLRYLAVLESYQLIRRKVILDDETDEVIERRIFIL